MSDLRSVQRWAPVLVGCVLSLKAGSARAVENLVANGSFEAGAEQAGVPADWQWAGNQAVVQRLALDTGRDGKHCARLECTAFNGDGPDFHAMLCQVGHVTVHRGQWYRIAFWAKAEGIRAGTVDVALSDTRRWENAGLSDAFTPGSEWQQFEFLFRAPHDLAAAASRLQFWVKSTGTLWLDDVVLTKSDERPQWFPQIATEGVTNSVPNSSFECGAANWGSFTWGLSGWAGNLYRLEGALDTKEAEHGRHSLKISLSPTNLPVFYFDYYDAVRQPVRRVLAANRGWFRVKPGEKLTLSAWLRADAEGVAGQLAVNEAPNHLLRKQVTVGREWRRHEFSFIPKQAFLFIAVGLDLEASKREAATLWVDAVQLERGERATAYQPRLPVESFIETAAADGGNHSRDMKASKNPLTPQTGPLGNIFTNAEDGIALVVRAFNNTDEAATARGKLDLTDFFDRQVWEREYAVKLAKHSGGGLELPGLVKGRQGFFRANWTTSAATQSLRCAVIMPPNGELMDSPFGFNHAFPWDFLVQLSRQAGVLWWRDWSAKWQTVEPARGQRK